MKLHLPLLSFLALTLSAKAELLPPPAEPVVDDYYGTSITDPFRYFENAEDPRVANWTRRIAEESDKQLAAFPLREKIFERLNQISEEKGANIEYLHRTSDGTIYLQMQGPDDANTMLYRKRPHEKVQLLLDPKSLMTSEQPLSIEYFSISPNQQYLAISISTGGSENGSLYLLEFPDLKVLADPLPRARWGSAYWLPDSSGFIYSRLQEVGPKGDPQERFQRSKCYLHHLGTPSSEDIPVVGIDVNPSVTVAPADLPFVHTLPGSDWLIAVNTTGVSKDYIIHLARLSDLLAHQPQWIPVAERRHMVGDGIAIHGNDLYLLTKQNAPNGKIVKTSLDQPNMEQAETIFEPTEGALQGMAWAKDGMYVKVLKGGPSQLVRLPFNAVEQPELIQTPENSSFRFQSLLGYGSEQDGVILQVRSWTEDTRFFVVHAHEDKAHPLNLLEQNTHQTGPELVTKQVMFPSHDGVEIPTSIIHRKGLKLDGTAPVMLSAYGSYGITIEPSRWNSDPILFEEGAIKVVAHVRGGGALGDEWRLAGRQATKPNTWKDLIAVAEGLVKENYTSPERICISGRSAGGITVGRAMTEAPEKFGAVLIGVGLCDAIRAETTPNGVPNIPEFGSVKTEAGFRALHAMSAYHHVKDQTSYPATLVFHGANDTRVELWQSLKMAARLMSATTSEEPILMRVDYQAGHSSGVSVTQRNQLDADILSFFFAHCHRPTDKAD